MAHDHRMAHPLEGGPIELAGVAGRNIQEHDTLVPVVHGGPPLLRASSFRATDSGRQGPWTLLATDISKRSSRVEAMVEDRVSGGDAQSPHRPGGGARRRPRRPSP